MRFQRQTKQRITSDYIRLRVCAGKKKHSTMDSAREEAIRFTEEYMVYKRAYHCPYCNSYHIGGARTQC